MSKPINQHVLIRDDNHLIRYARTRHLTITTRVSRFVYLLHTAPVPETTALPFEDRAATPATANAVGGATNSARRKHPLTTAALVGMVPDDQGFDSLGVDQLHRRPT